MPRWPPTHPDFLAALRVLAGLEVSHAEAWRALVPTAVRIGEPRPSYWKVRRRLIAERRRLKLRAERRAEIEQIVGELLAGLVLVPLGRVMQHKLAPGRPP